MRLRILTAADRPLIEDALNRYKSVLAPGEARRLNAAPFYANPLNVGFATFDGCALGLFAHENRGVFDAHLLCDFPWRGARAIRFGRAALAAVFTSRDASAIVARIPEENLASRRVCRALGGIPEAGPVEVFGRRCIAYRLDRGAWELYSAA